MRGNGWTSHCWEVLGNDATVYMFEVHVYGIMGICPTYHVELARNAPAEEEKLSDNCQSQFVLAPFDLP